MSVKFIGCFDEPPILSEELPKSLGAIKTNYQKNKHENSNYFENFVVPLLERVENSHIFFNETEYQ